MTWERPLWFGDEEVYSYGTQSWWPRAEREALATQRSVALYDLTPFSKFEIKGPDAEAELQRLIAADVSIEAGKTIQPTSLGGIYEITNGVTWDCMHCQNDKVFICSCRCMCCRKSGTDIVCPQCSIKVLKEDISHTDRINAIEKKAGRKALGQSTSSGLLSLAGRK